MKITYDKIQKLYEQAKEHTPSWYENFDSTEAKECLKSSVSKASSWAAETIVSFDSKVQIILGKDDTDNNGDL